MGSVYVLNVWGTVLNSTLGIPYPSTMSTLNTLMLTSVFGIVLSTIVVALGMYDLGMARV
jgi:hypothetical protein